MEWKHNAAKSSTTDKDIQAEHGDWVSSLSQLWQLHYNKYALFKIQETPAVNSPIISNEYWVGALNTKKPSR